MLRNTFELKAMDTIVRIEGTPVVDNDQWAQEIMGWFDDYENICSRFRLTSELSKLNQAPSDSVIVIHPTLFEILQKAMHYAVETDFYFNPFIGTALKALGYRTTFNELRNSENVYSDSYSFDMQRDESLVLIPEITAVIKKMNIEIDLGGIAKGWSVDKVKSMLLSQGIEEGIVNAGGDLFVWGDTERTIGLSHPEDIEKDIIQFNIRNGGVATSNTIYRSWLTDGKRFHHILDGRTGQSSSNDVVQATAFSINATEADILAKILCMLPSQEAIPWLEKYFPHASCILIKNDGKVVISQSIKTYISRLVM